MKEDREIGKWNWHLKRIAWWSLGPVIDAAKSALESCLSNDIINSIVLPYICPQICFKDFKSLDSKVITRERSTRRHCLQHLQTLRYFMSSTAKDERRVAFFEDTSTEVNSYVLISWCKRIIKHRGARFEGFEVEVSLT